MVTAFILGANGDMGKAVAEKFRAKGYSVIAPSRKELDLESRDSIEKYFSRNSLEIDVLAHCAGFNEPKPFEEILYSDLDKTLAVNFTGFYRIVQLLLPGMKKKGNAYILALSSLYGVIARAKRFSYVASKHALNGMVKLLAIELGPHNIKVNALSPGFVDTKMTRKNNSDAVIKGFEERIPLGRLASVNDIADAAYFLCSPENRYITGQNIIIDGGYSVGGFQK